MISSITRLFSKSCLVLHPVFRNNRGKLGEILMAEEAIGLAKSLDWNIIQDMKFIKDDDTLSEYKQQELKKLEQKGPSTIKLPDGQVLKNGQTGRIPGTSLEGTYYSGQMVFWETDTETDQSDNDDEWENVQLRQDLARGTLIRVRNPRSSTLFGSGQIETIGGIINDSQCEIVFINTQLTALQQRQLERKWGQILKDQSGLMVIDRFGIILKIFSERAKTKRAKQQLELAFLKYIKSRLTRDQETGQINILRLFDSQLNPAQTQKMEIVSSRSKGTSGKGFLGGSGETQTEIERRILNERQSKIIKEINQTNRKSINLKKDPTIKNFPSIAILGYTNAGKTALMNFLTGEKLVSENLLFQTLNTTARRLRLPSGHLSIVLDTVGFISDLPHELVDSFSATLEGIQQADILLHIRDISHPYTVIQKDTVMETLEQMGVEQEKLVKNYIEVWNKVDLMEEGIDLEEVEKSLYPIVPLSALYGVNINKLLETIDQKSVQVLNQSLYVLKFPLSEYNHRMNWLLSNTNRDSIDYSIEEDSQIITLEIYMNQPTLSRYQSQAGPTDEIFLKTFSNQIKLGVIIK